MKIVNLKDGEKPMTIIRTVEFHKGDVYRLPKSVAEIHVLSGQVWVTIPGKDIILRRGESAWFDRHERDAVLSPLGEAPLVVEELS